MLRARKENASCSVGPTSLAMLCFRANRGLVSNAPGKVWFVGNLWRSPRIFFGLQAGMVMGGKRIPLAP